MSRPITAPRPGEPKDFPLNVHESLAFELHVYCEALEANWTKVINRAVRELIARDLKENDGFRVRFEEVKARLLDEDRRRHESAGLRLVDTAGPGPARHRSPRKPKSPASGARSRKRTP